MCCRFTSVRTSRPAPASSGSDSASCPTTTALPMRSHAADPTTPRPSSRSPDIACGLRNPQRRQQAEGETGSERQPEHEGPDAKVQRGWQHDRIGHEMQQSLAQQVGGGETRDAARRRETQALGQQLTDQTSTTRAQRQAHRHLAVSRRRSRQEQVAQIRAGDEQHETRAAEQHEQRLRKITAQRGRSRRRALQRQPLIEEPLPHLGIGHRSVVRRQPLLEDDVHVRLRALERNAGLQPAEHVQPHHLLDAPWLVVQPVAAPAGPPPASRAAAMRPDARPRSRPGTTRA